MVLRIIAFLLCVASSFSSYAEELTEFDYPFLLGDWYWFSPSDEGVSSQGKQYRAMHIRFTSEYDYVVRLLRVDGEIDGWNGVYNIDEDALMLEAEGHPIQRHDYQLSYNQFILDGAHFTKLAPENLPGEWVSSVIEGTDVSGEVERLSMVLRPDFLFSFITTGLNGKINEQRGVYFIEEDHLVLMYEDGQHETRYHLGSGSNTLTLVNEQFGMEAVFERQ